MMLYTRIYVCQTTVVKEEIRKTGWLNFASCRKLTADHRISTVLDKTFAATLLAALPECYTWYLDKSEASGRFVKGDKQFSPLSD